jgi:hypothetical protein
MKAVTGETESDDENDRIYCRGTFPDRVGGSSRRMVLYRLSALNPAAEQSACRADLPGYRIPGRHS